MTDRVYTENGWAIENIDSSAKRYTLLRADPVTMNSGIAFNEKPVDDTKIRPCLKRVHMLSEQPSRADIMSILYALSLGQRLTTPKFSNAFVSSPGKTFFRRQAKLNVRLTQQSITELTALANCFIVPARNEKIGATRQVFEEFMLTINTLGGLIYAMKDETVKRAAPTTIRADARKCAIKQLFDDDESDTSEISALIDSARTLSDGIAITLGCMMLGCMRDRSITKKDQNSATIRTAFYDCQDLRALIHVPEELFTCDALDIVKKKAYNVNHIWVIDETGKEVHDFLVQRTQTADKQATNSE